MIDKTDCFFLFFWLSLVPQENCTKFKYHCRIAETREDDFIQKMDWLYSAMDNKGYSSALFLAVILDVR